VSLEARCFVSAIFYPSSKAELPITLSIADTIAKKFCKDFQKKSLRFAEIGNLELISERTHGPISASTTSFQFNFSPLAKV